MKTGRQNPKSEIRGPKEVRIPNPETGPAAVRSVLDCGSPLPLSIRAERGNNTALEPAEWILPPLKSARGLAPFKSWRDAVASLVLAWPVIIASAQPYSIDWYTIDGGGGVSSGGTYSLSGIIGQPDASQLVLQSSDGRFSLQPGLLRGAVQALVKGQHTFYNRSAWDGNDPAANALDDGAIPSDKTALLPGGTASFANYTSYHRGLNGIMVDIDDLEGVPTAADFTFKAGNNITPATWPAAPVPVNVAVRAGAGAGGSDRVTLIWNDNNLDATADPNEAVANRWLGVTVLPTDATGLSAPHTFYYGNAVGEAGNSASDAKVDPADELLARANPRNVLNPAPIDFDFDFNRDKRVDPADQLIARANPANVLNALKLIALTAGPALASQSGADQHDVLVAIELEVNGGLVLLARGEPGRRYTLERTDQLVPAHWQITDAATADAHGIIHWSISPDPEAAQAFFRITSTAASGPLNR